MASQDGSMDGNAMVGKHPTKSPSKTLIYGIDAAQATHKVTWKWIKGHAGHAENEHADELARAGMAPFKKTRA